MTSRWKGWVSVVTVWGVLGGACKKAPPPAAEFAVNVPLGLSTELNIPPDNPVTAEKVALGRMLYFDKRLSVDGTVSCATCHDPHKGWSDAAPVSTGVRGQKGTRNAPTVVNSTYHPVQFWDGREPTLEAQAKGPIVNPLEMGFPHHDLAVAAVRKIPGYQPLFEKAFGGPPTLDRIVQAIAAFERTVLSGNSRYDRFIAGDPNALTPAERRGLEVFVTKGKCIQCHVGPNFTDGKFHNLGVGMNRPNSDLGRYVVTQEEKDKGAFRTPALRDIDRHAPYMHDGSQKTLEEVIVFYDKGGEKNPYLDPLIVPLQLTVGEEADLLAYLRTLDGEPYPIVEPPELPR